MAPTSRRVVTHACLVHDVRMSDDDVNTAMSDAHLGELDARGLMALAAARKHLATVDAFGPFKPDAAKHDTTWAALVSLADAEEFVSEARRLEWKASPRGMYNVAPFTRYGAGILPWLLDACDRDTKTLRNTPWCIAPCLVRVGGKEAFEAVLEMEQLATESYVHPSIDALFESMLDAHPGEGWPALATRVLQGEPRANATFAKLVKGRSRGALDAIESALGKQTRAEIEARFKVTARLEAGEILGLMDAAATQNAWPIWNHDFEETMEYLALRLVAVRGDGDRWGICLERLTGCSTDYFTIDRFAFGSEVTVGKVDGVTSPDIEITGPAEYDGLAVGSTIRGPKGELTLTKEHIKSLNLKPGKGTEPDSGGEQLVLMRAYLAEFPHTIFLPVERTLAVLKLPEKPRMLVVTETFKHAGQTGEIPSNSKTYKSLAAAIVSCDAEKFIAGTDNTDWRKHLVKGSA